MSRMVGVPLLLVAVMTAGCTSANSFSTASAQSSEGQPPSTATVVSPPASPAGTSAESLPFASADACDEAPPETSLSTGTMHTIVMSREPVTVRATAEPGRVCPGGRVRLTVSFRNDGGVRVDLKDLFLILSGGMDKWEFGLIADVSLEAGAEHFETVDATIPLVAPAQYGIFVYGFTPGGVLFVNEPAG